MALRCNIRSDPSGHLHVQISYRELPYSYGGSDHSMFGAGQRMGNGKTLTPCSSAHGTWSCTSETLSLAIKESSEFLWVAF